MIDPHLSPIQSACLGHIQALRDLVAQLSTSAACDVMLGKLDTAIVVLADVVDVQRHILDETGE